MLKYLDIIMTHVDDTLDEDAITHEEQQKINSKFIFKPLIFIQV
jgi:hypothetical protein